MNLSNPAAWVLMVGAAGSLAAGYLTREHQRARYQIAQERLAEHRLHAIDREIATSLEIVHSLGAFYDSSERVEHDEFVTFTRPLLARHTDILALQWVPRVEETERSTFEGAPALSITERDAEGRLVPSGPRPRYHPVQFVAPLQGNQRSLGFDVASDPGCAAALGEASRTRSIAVTRRTPLAWRAGGDDAVLVVRPVYTSSQDGGEPMLTGFVQGAFGLTGLLRRGAVPDGLRVALLDESARGEGRVLAATGFDAGTAAEARGLVGERELMVGSRVWRVLVDPDPRAWSRAGTAGFFAVSLAGLVLTMLGAAYVRSLLGRGRMVEQEVRERTAELEEATAKLEAESTALAIANAELDERNRELDEFSYVASHDLQEPLRKLISFSSMLEVDMGGEIPERAREDVRFITDAAKRMGTLVQDLLALSRAGKGAMNCESLALDPCLDAALEALAGSFEETGARVEREPLPGVFGDRTMVTQLFQNMIGNAVKFRREGVTPRVRVRARESGGEIEVAIEDNGIGIEAEYRDRVFAPFKRLHGRGDYDGSGIGLAICSKTVQRHGGRMWVESEPGRGSTFFFTLTRATEPSGHDYDPERAQRHHLVG